MKLPDLSNSYYFLQKKWHKKQTSKPMAFNLQDIRKKSKNKQIAVNFVLY